MVSGTRLLGGGRPVVSIGSWFLSSHEQGVLSGFMRGGNPYATTTQWTDSILIWDWKIKPWLSGEN